MLFEIEMLARCRGTAPSSSSAEDTTAAPAAAADTAGTASAASFEPGHRVQLMGLEDRPDLNDQTGVVVLIRPDKRLTVIVDNGEIIAVRPVKLALSRGQQGGSLDMMADPGRRGAVSDGLQSAQAPRPRSP